MEYKKENNQSLKMGEEIGSGGEAIIYRVVDEPEVAAKIYRIPTLKREKKLRAMLANPPEDTDSPFGNSKYISIAWPKELIFDGSGYCVGFLMPYIDRANSIDLFSLFTLRARKRRPEFDFTWRDLLIVAIHLTRIVKLLHDKGYVLGDINESNVLVNKEQLVTLVDCDSIQVMGVGEDGQPEVFRCPVGKSEYTPPELQGCNFGEVDRNISHDNFSLSVLIFILLTEGVHPFQGAWSGKGEPPSREQNIKDGRFPYLSRKEANELEPPKPGIGFPFKFLPDAIKNNMQLCFVAGHTQPSKRPSVTEWWSALRTLKNRSLEQCEKNSQHWFGDNLSHRCPWCENVEQKRPDNFPPLEITSIKTLIQTSTPICTLAFSANGKLLASGKQEDSINLWNVASGNRLKTLISYSGTVNALTFSSDGKVLVSGRGDGTVELWDITVGRLLRTFISHSNTVKSVAFSPDGKILASAGWDGNVKLWDFTSGYLIKNFSVGQNGVNSIAFSPYGKQLAAGGTDGVIRIWRVATGELLHEVKAHAASINALSYFLASGEVLRIASGSDDTCINLWGFDASKKLKLKKSITEHTAPVLSLAVSASGKVLASGSADKTIGLWDSITGSMIELLNGNEGIINSVAFNTSDKVLVSSDANTIRLWQVGKAKIVPSPHLIVSNPPVTQKPNAQPSTVLRSTTVTVPLVPQLLTTLNAHSQSIQSVAFSPNGETLASASVDKIVKLWNVKTRKEIIALKSQSDTVTTVQFAPDGKILATAGTDAIIRLWDAKTGQELRSLKGHSNTINSIAFSPDSKFIASTGRDTTMRLWDVSNGQQLLVYPKQSHVVKGVIFNPNGRTLATCGMDSTIRIWSVENNQALRVVNIPRWAECVHFNSNGTLLVSGNGHPVLGVSEPVIRIWDPRNGQEIKNLTGHSSWVNSLATSPNDKILASGSADKTIKLWDIVTGKLLETLIGHTGSVNSVAISPDGKTLASGSSDCTIKLWNL